MRKEVVDTIAQFTSYIDDFDIFLNQHLEIPEQRFRMSAPGRTYCLEFKLGNYIWNIYFDTDKKNRDGVEVYCWDCPTEDGIVFSTNPKKFSKDHIKGVRQALPVFVEGMIKVFPNILEECQPILDASVPKKRRLIVTKRGFEKYEARLALGDPKSWLAGFGKTEKEAIGDYLYCHSDLFDFEIDCPSDKQVDLP